ncbi:hypothetical protein, partial [Roseovarius nitratireducens]|uniref:hypothetical protein n=1 Tax=Roseovarius nitratireducens TaxID=2044597 RepID=UPI00197D33C2
RIAAAKTDVASGPGRCVSRRRCQRVIGSSLFAPSTGDFSAPRASVLPVYNQWATHPASTTAELKQANTGRKGVVVIISRTKWTKIKASILAAQ